MAPATTLPLRIDRRRACASLGIALAAPFAQRARAAETLVRVTGTGSALGGIRLVAQAYREQQPDLRIETLPAIGSPGAIAALAARRIDLAVTNRLPTDAENRRLPLSAFEYARTPVVIAVAARLGITAITTDELVALYRPGAQFANGQRARPVLRPAAAADSVVVRTISPAVAAAVEAAAQQRGMLVAATDSEAADLLLRISGAFGSCTLAMIATEKLPLAALALDGRVPSVEAFAAGSYPFGKPLCAVVPADAPPAVAGFAAFLRSPTARALMRAHGHLPT